MSFLHGWAIALALAAIVPFILHLRRRRTDRRISFPALRYLTRAEEARSRSLVASDILLLATRIGLLIALALAAAGPLLGRGGAGDHAPTDLAIVLDNSASTGRMVEDRPLFASLLDRARTTLEAARPEDRIWVFPTLGSPVAAGVSAARAAEALSRIELEDGAADLGAAVMSASAALPADRDRRREVQLISDLQRAGFTASPDSSGDQAPIVAYAPPPPSEANAAVAALQLTGGTTVPSGLGHGVIVRPVRHRAGGASDSAEIGEASIRLQIDGRIAGAARMPWGANETLGLPELSVGTHAGRVEVDPEGARADDIRFFSIRVVPPPAVRFIGPDTSFARIGIETLRQAGRLGGAEAASVTVVEGASGVGSFATLESTRTVVLIPPADPIDLPAFNQMLSGLDIPWTARIDPDRGSLALSDPNAAFSLSGIRVHERYLLRRAATGATSLDSTILSTEDGEPWLVRIGGAARTVLLLSSPLIPRASDLPTHPAMIPFLEALLVQWSHLSGWPPSDFDAGVPIALPEWAETVTTPDGASASVEGGSLYTAEKAGVYRIAGRDRGGPTREADFAVNVPEEELDPTPMGGAELSGLFPGRSVFIGGPGDAEWRDEIFRARRGRDAAPWLLAIALALTGVELFLATPGRARKRDAEARGWGRAEAESEARAGATQFRSDATSRGSKRFTGRSPSS